MWYLWKVESLVLQMEDRDNIYQTNFHRYGYAEQIEYKKTNILLCEKYLTNQDDTYNYIVENLCKAVICYDNLVANSNTMYQKQNNPHPDGKRWCVTEQAIGNYYWGTHNITSNLDLLRKFDRLNFQLPIHTK